MISLLKYSIHINTHAESMFFAQVHTFLIGKRTINR